MFSDRDDKRNVELKGWRVGFQGPALRCAGAAAGRGYMGYMEGRSKLSHTLFASQGRGVQLGGALVGSAPAYDLG